MCLNYMGSTLGMPGKGWTAHSRYRVASATQPNCWLSICRYNEGLRTCDQSNTRVKYQDAQLAVLLFTRHLQSRQPGADECAKFGPGKPCSWRAALSFFMGPSPPSAPL